MNRPVDVADTTMPDDLKEQVSVYIHAARDMLERQGTIAPVAFIGIDDGNGVAIFPWGNLRSTEVASTVLRRMCRESHAAWVIVLMESYILRGVTALTQYDYRPVREHPDHEEAVCILVETHERSWQGFAITHQIEGKAGRQTFGQMEFHESIQSTGRFVGLLPNTGRQH